MKIYLSYTILIKHKVKGFSSLHIFLIFNNYTDRHEVTFFSYKKLISHFEKVGFSSY